MKNKQIIDYIAVLGFAGYCSHKNQCLAQAVGRIIVSHDYGVSAGNLTGTFRHALKQAKESCGNTLCIVEKHAQFNDSRYCDIIQVVANQQQKHIMIARQSIGAVVIGGDIGTEKLIQQFLRLGKPVVAIKSTGGIVDHDLDNRVSVTENLDSVMDVMHQHLPILAFYDK